MENFCSFYFVSICDSLAFTLIRRFHLRILFQVSFQARKLRIIWGCALLVSDFQEMMKIRNFKGPWVTKSTRVVPNEVSSPKDFTLLPSKVPNS